MCYYTKMSLTVVEYTRADGLNPFKTWFNELPPQAAAKVAAARARLELGNTSSIKWIGAIADYRIDWGPGFRIYLAKDGFDLIVLLGGGTKQRQQADINRANVLWLEYKTRKAAQKSKRR